MTQEERDMMGETLFDVKVWSPRELAELDTKTLLSMVDEDEVEEYKQQFNPDEIELREFLIERII